MTAREHSDIDEITRRVIGCAIEVHQTLGPGLLESVYEKCLSYELIQAGLEIETQKEVPVQYKEVQIDCGFRVDLLIEKSLIVEVKAVEKMVPVHEAQLLTYMRLMGIKTGLLINFHEKLLKNGLRRFVL